jgi:hypothetical protein
MEILRDAAIDSAIRSEALMLDVVFVALGFAVIAVMAAYAVGLRRL